MFVIPGIVISTITFPGVIVHEFAHQVFCRLFGITVLDVKYFRFGNPAGYVIHEEPRTVAQHVLISIGPFLVNSLLGAIIYLPAAMPILSLRNFLRYSGPGGFLNVFLFWLGLSIAMHAFPSVGDANSLWRSVWGKEAPILARLLVTPLIGVIYLCAIGSFFWLDAIYGLVVVTGLPNALVALLS